jgi:inosine/xanthosine triphosphatase
MKKVIVASENPVKVAVARRAFLAVYPGEEFEFVAIKSESGVPNQPMNDETEQGAINRLNFIKSKNPEADFWISQEGGTFTDGDKLFNRAWIAVCDKEGYVAKSSTAQFYLPPKIVEYINEGMELGEANDKFFNSINSKHGIGAIGHLTDGLIDRENYYLPAAIIALSQMKHQDWYKP